MVDDLVDTLHGILSEFEIRFLTFLCFGVGSGPHLIAGGLEVVDEVGSALDTCIC